jgi:hypothetical protein
VKAGNQKALRKLLFVIVAGEALPSRVHFFGRLSFPKGFLAQAATIAPVRRFAWQNASPMPIPDEG